MTSAVLPTYARADLAFERGEGVYAFTADGTRYLDFGSGIAVNALGHTHPHLVSALSEQAGKIWHTANTFRIQGQERLAERLAAATFADVAFFCNSGAEANEAAIKMARKYQSATGHPERWRIITFEGAFHGRTLATIAAGGQEKHLAGFGPKVDGFDQVPFEDREAVKKAVTQETAAILIEPIQGEGGVRAASPQFMRYLRAVCDENDLLLVLDEVQCGVGRTGWLFAHEMAGITPDIMAIAKALGGGFPIGACLATRRAAIGMTAGTHGSTFGGNPLAMAVANAVLDVILAPGFLEHVRRMALLLRQRLAGLIDTYPMLFEEIRGEGLMIGLKCAIPNTEILTALRDQHLLAVGGGDNTIRLLPPLIIEEKHIGEAMDALHAMAMTLTRAQKESAA
ncbi:MAG: acetylornithine/succinylornithine family transaminase [Alphaproteobacteria bacterium]|nr:acetylornithine/succinylornithine family transaminase [Alphaproteobacteria bacterium]